MKALFLLINTKSGYLKKEVLLAKIDIFHIFNV